MMRQRVERVRLEISAEYYIQRILIEEIGGAVTDFHFRNSVENAAVSEDKFRFTVPTGVHITENMGITPRE